MQTVKLYPLIRKAEISKKVKELAKQISKDYKNKNPLFIGVLKGAWIFLADLVRNLDIEASCDFIQISSYGKGTESSGKIKVISDITNPIKGKDVILVEDIIDTGLTLQYLKNLLFEREPNSLKVCSLLDKPSRHKVEVSIDYLGFTVPNKFVVGYGIDWNERFRNLPYIGYVEFVE